MDYFATYERLIERARCRELSGYCERHHIIPKCLGGSNHPDNIVKLTPEEHYLAHQLLVKTRPRDHRLLWAASNMTGKTQRMRGRKNKLYGWLKKRLGQYGSKSFLGKQHSEETRKKMSDSRRGKKRTPHSAETKAVVSQFEIRLLRPNRHICSMPRTNKIASLKEAGQRDVVSGAAAFSASRADGEIQWQRGHLRSAEAPLMGASYRSRLRSTILKRRSSKP